MTTFWRSLGRDLGLEVVARVVVRREGRELAGAGVDGLEDRADAELPARVADLLLGRGRAAGRSGRRRSRGPWRSGRCRRRASRRRAISSATSLISTIWSRNQGSIFVASNTCSTVAPARSACCTVTMRPSVGTLATLEQLGLVDRGSSPQWKLRPALLERPQRLLQRGGVVAADRHRLADALHRGGERGVGRRELLEREPRHLDDDVVERRLEARRGAPPVISLRDLVEPVADRELRGDLRDRESRSPSRPARSTARRAGSSR